MCVCVCVCVCVFVLFFLFLEKKKKPLKRTSLPANVLGKVFFFFFFFLFICLFFRGVNFLKLFLFVFVVGLFVCLFVCAGKLSKATFGNSWTVLKVIWGHKYHHDHEMMSISTDYSQNPQQKVTKCEHICKLIVLALLKLNKHVTGVI